MQYVLPLLLLLSPIVSSLSVNAQSFRESLDCQVNAKTDLIWAEGRTDIIDAVFKWQPGCSGTLINRKVGASELGLYFVTAQHCVNEIEEDDTLSFYFNYQSPNFRRSIYAHNQSGLAF